MAYANYCTKCKREVPVGECCPFCDKKLTKAGERFSYGYVRIPVRDWFAWNRYLRILLPIWAIVYIILLLGELFAKGEEGLIRLLQNGILASMGISFILIIAVIMILLVLHGKEQIFTVFDKDGVTVSAYKDHPNGLQRLFCRSEEHTKHDKYDADWLPDEYELIRRVFLPWDQIKKVRQWRGGATLLLYRPFLWLVVAVPYASDDTQIITELVRQKVKKLKIPVKLD